MRKLFILPLILVLFFTLTSAQKNGWVNKSEKISTQDIDVFFHSFFVNENENWITSSSKFVLYNTTQVSIHQVNENQPEKK